MPRPLVFLSPIHKASRQIDLYLGDRIGGLATHEGHLVSYLRSYAPSPISELHRVFGLKKSTLTSMLDRLESRGLTRRELHPSDRRSFLVHLTDDGRKVANEVQAPVDELESRIRAEVTDEELAGFRRVMEAIAQVTHIDVKPKEKS